MWSFIFEIVIFVALAGILAITLRVLPRVSNEVFTGSHSFIKAHEVMVFFEQMDSALKSVLEKFLRRAKVIILKLDNFVTKKIAEFSNDRAKEKNTFVIPEEKISPERPEDAKGFDFVTTVPVAGDDAPMPLPKKRGRKKVAL
jgi:hypothetical protein